MLRYIAVAIATNAKAGRGAYSRAGAPSLKWQRFKPCEKFARMIECHWDVIAAYYTSENKVSLGCVEGLNNTIRVIQPKASAMNRIWP